MEGQNHVPAASIICGALLIGLGLDGYLNLFGLIQPSETHSPTALIPAYFGTILVLCGAVALKESLLKHAMHLAAMVGLIGFLAAAWRAIPNLPKWLAGDAQADGFKPAAVRLQVWMAGICLVFVVLCVNSFIQARRRRAASLPGPAGGL
jgi:hypothetical protein